MIRHRCISWMWPALFLGNLSALATEPPQILSGQHLAEQFTATLEQPSFGPWYARLSDRIATRIHAVARDPHVESLALGNQGTWVGMSRGLHHVELGLSNGGDGRANLYGDGSVDASSDGTIKIKAPASLDGPYDQATARPLRVLGRPAALVWEHSMDANDPSASFSRTRLYLGPRAGLYVRVPHRFVKAAFKSR